MKKLLVILLLFFVTGCFDYRELNTLGIVTSIAIDKDKDNYEVSVLISNSKKDGSGETAESGTVLYSGKGHSISAALKEIDAKIPRELYIGHISVVVISEEIAKDNIIDVLDYLVRNPETSKRFELVLAHNNKAKDIIEIVTPLDTFTSQSIADNIKIADMLQAKSTNILYSEFLYLLLEKGIEPVMPSISVQGSIKDGTKNKSLEQTTPSATLKLDNLGIFKDNKLIGYASENESKGINIIRNKIERMNIYIDNATINISSLSTKLKYQDDLNFILNVKATGSILEDNNSDDLTDPKVIKEIEKQTKKEIKKLINKGYHFALKKETDVFGFGNLLYKHNPKKFETYEDSNDILKDVNLKINVSFSLDTKGAASKNLKEELDEIRKN